MNFKSLSKQDDGKNAIHYQTQTHNMNNLRWLRISRLAVFSRKLYNRFKWDFQYVLTQKKLFKQRFVRARKRFKADVVCGKKGKKEKREIDICSDSLGFVQSSVKLWIPRIQWTLIAINCEAKSEHSHELLNFQQFHAISRDVLSRDETLIADNYFIKQLTIKFTLFCQEVKL